MYKGSSTQHRLSFRTAFTEDEKGRLSNRLEKFAPGEYQYDFETHFNYTFGPLFTPILKNQGPSVFVCEDGLCVNETFFWEGVKYKDAVYDQLIPLRFEQAHEFSSSHFIDLYNEATYPVDYHLPKEQEIVQAVSTLLIAHLNSPVVMYFLIKNQVFFKELFLPVYHAIGTQSIHEGVLEQIASEPPNYHQYNSRHMSWKDINDQSKKTHTDITRSFNLTIKAGRETWEIQEDKMGVDKAKLFNEALTSLERMHTLPQVVSDALRFGAHQSGFLNEAVIAVGVYVTEMTNYQITLPQSGIRRHLTFTAVNDHIEVLDRCEWHEVSAPQRSPGGSELDVARVTLKKPLIMIYRYTLSADNKHQLSHQIKELSLDHEKKIKKLAGMKS